MSDCDHNCDSCNSSDCEERSPKSLIEKTHEFSDIKKVIAVVSGKGGVGKSLVTGLLASLTNKKGHKVAVLDADITGPSIPKMFGVSGRLEGHDKGIFPKESKNHIKIVSSNLMLENDNDPVLWRGPLIAGLVKQFWTDVIWDEVDYMFVDMPPGTGDVPLTVFQSIKVDGIIVVTSPQDLVSMIVEKAVKMANKMNIPVIGVVENMSYINCPKCGEKIEVFGTSKVKDVARDFNLEALAKMPIDSEIAKACDEGRVEDIRAEFLDKAVEKILKL